MPLFIRLSQQVLYKRHRNQCELTLENNDNENHPLSIYLLIRIFCRQVLIMFATSGELSRRTVSSPLQSSLS